MATTHITVSCISRGWGSSVPNNVAAKSNNFTARSTTATNKEASASAEPSPSKKTRKVQDDDVLPPTNFKEYMDKIHVTVNQTSVVCDTKEINAAVLILHASIKGKKRSKRSWQFKIRADWRFAYYRS